MQQSQIQSRLLTQEWFDPELEDLNTKPQITTLKSGSDVIDVAKIGVDVAELGLKVAKFAWDIIKSNKAVVDSKATTTSVLYKETDGLDYKGAQQAKTHSYTLSVRDAWIKSWELIHADIIFEGTYHASPLKKDIPDGFYLPAINVYASKAHADFPCQPSAKASLSQVTNMGSSKLDPMITILSALDFGWLLQRRHRTLKFTARDSSGFRQVA